MPIIEYSITLIADKPGKGSIYVVYTREQAERYYGDSDFTITEKNLTTGELKIVQ